MGPIQSGINQSLAILSLASSQSPQAQAQRKATSDTNAFNKFRKTDQNTPFALGERSQEMFKELQEQAVESNLKAGRTEELLDIKEAKPEAENIKNDISEVAQNYFKLGPESVEYVTNPVFENIKQISQEKNPNITSKEVRDKLQKVLGIAKNDEELNQMKNALEQSRNKLSTKTRLKSNMDMMKNALKEDN